MEDQYDALFLSFLIVIFLTYYECVCYVKLIYYGYEFWGDIFCYVFLLNHIVSINYFNIVLILILNVRVLFT